MAIGAGGKGEQRFVEVAAPGEKSGVVADGLRQLLDFVGVDGALRFGNGPLQALAFPLEHRSAKIAPAGEAVFPGEH